MVLRKTLVALAAVLVLPACLTRQQVPRMPEKTVVAVAFVMDNEHQAEVTDVPASLRKQVAQALVDRNLEPRELPFDSYAPVFKPVRDTQRRLARLTNGEAPVVVLVETKAVFFSQLNGRYRWMVYARLTAARKDAPALTWDMDQSAFVDFEHQREPEAIKVVSGAIADRVGALLDNYLGGESQPQARAADPRSEALYFVMVDRFANGDPSNDGQVDRASPIAFHGGDLQGVLDHLDALKELGVGAVWLSPVFKMRTTEFFGHAPFHGYWVEDFGEVEPRFGDEATLRRLSEQMHARGMRLVLDVVLNHVDMDAPLAKEKPEWFHHRGPLQGLERSGPAGRG